MDMSGLSTNGLDESLPRQHGMFHHEKKEEKRVHLLQRLFFPSSNGPILLTVVEVFTVGFAYPVCIRFLDTNFYFGACFP